MPQDHTANGHARTSTPASRHSHRHRHTVHHHHTHTTPPDTNQPRIVPLHPANNGKNWLIALLAIALVVIVLIAFFARSGSAQPDNKPAPVTKDDSKPAVKEEKKTEEKPASSKSSGNSGKKNNNVNVEGSHNNIHIGDKVSVHPTTVIKETVVVKETVVINNPPRVVVVHDPAPVVVKTTDCEDERVRHEYTVAVWKARYGFK